MRHSHSRWHRDFDDFRNEYNQKFASAIFDYTVLVVAGELRHCLHKASQYIKDYYDAASHQRNTVYKECNIYRAHDILAAGIRMFDTCQVEWKDSFGGDKWKKIARAGIMRGKVSDGIFIDHCVDLSHNNSVYFDKGAGIFSLPGNLIYQDFLNLKYSCEPQTLISVKRGVRFNQLLQRAIILNIINVKAADDLFIEQTDKDKAETHLFAYQPIQWGDKRLDCSDDNIISKTGFVRDQRRKSYRDDGYNDDDMPNAA